MFNFGLNNSALHPYNSAHVAAKRYVNIYSFILSGAVVACLDLLAHYHKNEFSFPISHFQLGLLTQYSSRLTPNNQGMTIA